MKTKNWLKAWAILAVLGLFAAGPAFGATILIDLGNAISWRGVDVPNPDANGHYWNSVWSGAYYPGLVDINGNVTSINFGFSSAGGTDSYNGPAGVTSNPPTPAQIAATDIDAAALGNLGVKEAAMDYYVNSTFEIQGLDPAKKYNLTFFGSHKFSPDTTTVYSVYTDNTYTTLVASVTLDVQDAMYPWLHNRDKVAVLTGLSPQMYNILYVKFAGLTGVEGYLNALQIEEVPEPTMMSLMLLGGLLARKRSR